ncbi:MAG: RnfABCDGE type electron transport complex subunit D [Planctomycetota bacterium]
MKRPDLIVSYPPHWRHGVGVASAMYGFVLALAPATLFGLYLYGIEAARVVSVAVVSCVVLEVLTQKLFRRPVSVTDGSAVLSGLLLGLILPPSAPFWLVVIGSLVTIVVGKHVYGGLGCNPFNAVLVGWAVLVISWKARMDLNFAFVNIAPGAKYPLGVLWKEGATALGQFNLWDLFVGREIGGVGCTSDLLLLIGGVFLILRGLISWRIPVSFLIGVAAASTLFRLAGGGAYAGPLFHLVAGNTMIGAFFLATDYSSSPVGKWGMVVFGLGCGLLTVLLRVWSGYPDGTFFAILMMNMTTVLLDMIRPRPRPWPVVAT